MKRVFIPIGVALKQARDAYGYPKDHRKPEKAK